MLIPLLFKTFRDHVRGIAGWVSGIVALIAVQLAVYPTVRDTTSRVTDFADAFPEAFKKIFRMEEYGTAVGYLSTELFSATLPSSSLQLALRGERELRPTKSRPAPLTSCSRYQSRGGGSSSRESLLKSASWCCSVQCCGWHS